MWAIGRFDLGLSEDEIWRTSIAEFNALRERQLKHERRQDYRTLLICCTLINTILRPREPLRPEDFLPAKPQTPQEQLAVIKMANAAFGGEVVRKG